MIKRKISFGTWSDRGDRLMSVIPMIIKSGKSVLEKESLLGKAVSLSLIA